VIFALTSLAWAAPFVVIAWRRRRGVWIVVAAVAGAIGTAATVDLFAHPPGEFYKPRPPAELILAIIALGVVAALVYGGDAVPNPEPRSRPWLAQASLVGWVLISLAGMTVGLSLSEDVGNGAQEPGAAVFAAACLFWSLPYLVLASRRRTTAWIILGSVSIAIALFGIVYLFINPTPCRCD
jgi:hypothetical protein